MELKDQILQTKERKKGFLNAMPKEMRTQIDSYHKMERLEKRVWIIPVATILISVCVYLVACFATTTENRWILHAILAGLWIVAGIIFMIILKSVCNSAKKAITAGAKDYVDEWNAINSRLAGLEKAEKERIEAEKQEAKAKARAEAAQREAEAALQRQQAVLQANHASPQQEANTTPQNSQQNE